MTETADEIVDRVLSRQARTTPTNGSTPDDHNRSSGGTWCQGLFNAEALRTEEFPPLTWIVPDILPAEGVALLCSKPKLGKSWCVLDLCLGCTMNRLILGTIKPKQGDVLYLALEDSKRRLQRRITKILPTFGGKWPERLSIKTEWRRLHEGGLDDIRAWYEATKKNGGNPIMVAVDVLAKVRKPTGNRQLYEADYEALAGLTTLANELGIGILVVTHVRKMAADDLMETVSGSFGTTGAVDTILVMASKASGTVLDVRGRDVESAELAIQFSKATCRWTILGAAAEVHVSDQRAKVLSALKEAGEPMRVAALKGATGMTDNAAEALLSRMAKDGTIKRVAKGEYADKDYELQPPSDGKPSQRRNANLTHLTDTRQDELGNQPVGNACGSFATLQPDAPDAVLTDCDAQHHPPKLCQARQDVRTDSQATEAASEFQPRSPDRQKSGSSGSASPDDLGIPEGLRRCDHCGQPGTAADPLSPWDCPGRPDGVRLHARCEESWTGLQAGDGE
jgi:AAA domain